MCWNKIVFKSKLSEPLQPPPHLLDDDQDLDAGSQDDGEREEESDCEEEEVVGEVVRMLPWRSTTHPILLNVKPGRDFIVSAFQAVWLFIYLPHPSKGGKLTRKLIIHAIIMRTEDILLLWLNPDYKRRWPMSKGKLCTFNQLLLVFCYLSPSYDIISEERYCCQIEDGRNPKEFLCDFHKLEK